MAQEREPSNLAHWNRESSNLTLETETFSSVTGTQDLLIWRWKENLLIRHIGIENLLIRRWKQRTF